MVVGESHANTSRQSSTDMLMVENPNRPGLASEMTITARHSSPPNDNSNRNAIGSIGSSNGQVKGNGTASGNINPLDDDDATRPGLGAAPRKVDVSHFPHYGLKRGMACTFCRRRKLRCSGDRPSCTNCIKHTKLCEYGPPVKEPKKQTSAGSIGMGGVRVPYDIGIPNSMPHQQGGLRQGPPFVTSLSDLQPSALYLQQPVQHSMGYDYYVGSALDANGLGMDPNLMAINTMQTTNTANAFQQASPFCDMQQQSPFVAAPPSLVPLAQPVIGMPPYSSTGYTSFNDPNLAIQQPHWLASPSAPASVPRTAASLPPLSYGTVSVPQTAQTTPLTVSEAQCISAIPTASLTCAGSDHSSPDDGQNVPPQGAVSIPQSESPSSESVTLNGAPNVLSSRLYRDAPSLPHTSDGSPVEGLTERLGEFLFSATSSAVKDEDSCKRRRGTGGRVRPTSPASVARLGREYDGLLDASRTLLLDCFLAHSTLFFEMSIPRFRFRMTFSDRRRPSLALLNAMYLWATRISNSPQMSAMEQHFFDMACKHLDSSTATVDRLIDAVRAAMLLSAYSHSSGRHHEGWCLAGHAIRLVLSCGLHRIKSCVHQPEEPPNPFLRNRFFLLPPPEDAVELGERIHAFWAVFAIDRCGSLATGYPPGLQDSDIITPFPRHLTDIASRTVSERDDVTVRDLYRGASAENDIPYTKWVKCVAILERSAKLCFLEPAADSPYARAWSQYMLTVHRDPMQSKPPEYLNQPKYRTPREYRECLLAVEQLVSSIGDEGVFPVVRRMNAEHEGSPEPVIPTNIIMLHHMVAAIHMVLHDINTLGVDNAEALKAAGKSVLLFRAMPQIPFTDVDAFVVLVWSMIAKVFIKEIHRLSLKGDKEGAQRVSLDADTVIDEMSRIGQTMCLARTQAKAITELKNAALSAGDKDASQPLLLPQLESFMFPQQM